MAKGTRIPKEIKYQILKRIKEERDSANHTAFDSGINTKTVYNWLAKENQRRQTLLCSQLCSGKKTNSPNLRGLEKRNTF